MENFNNADCLGFLPLLKMKHFLNQAFFFHRELCEHVFSPGSNLDTIATQTKTESIHRGSEREHESFWHSEPRCFQTVHQILQRITQEDKTNTTLYMTKTLKGLEQLRGVVEEGPPSPLVLRWLQGTNTSFSL